MNDLNQSPPSNGGMDGEDKKKGALIYFLGIIIIAVIAVGYLILKSIGLL